MFKEIGLHPLEWARPGIPTEKPREREVPEIPNPVIIPPVEIPREVPLPRIPTKPLETPRTPVPA